MIVDAAEPTDGRYRAATLEAPGGWIVMESYNDWLREQRELRRRAGLWSELPDPPPFPIGHEQRIFVGNACAAPLEEPILHQTRLFECKVGSLVGGPVAVSTDVRNFQQKQPGIL